MFGPVGGGERTKRREGVKRDDVGLRVGFNRRPLRDCGGALGWTRLQSKSKEYLGTHKCNLNSDMRINLCMAYATISFHSQ